MDGDRTDGATRTHHLHDLVEGGVEVNATEANIDTLRIQSHSGEFLPQVLAVADHMRGSQLLAPLLCLRSGSGRHNCGATHDMLGQLNRSRANTPCSVQHHEDKIFPTAICRQAQILKQQLPCSDVHQGNRRGRSPVQGLRLATTDARIDGDLLGERTIPVDVTCEHHLITHLERSDSGANLRNNTAAIVAENSGVIAGQALTDLAINGIHSRRLEVHEDVVFPKLRLWQR
mmetsp:Transcript_47639/g.113179  ORF Transcript_47639/g.113179 Transcript_47639/m.113179 type:complete len:231 (-) Transcript_47639:131-823(-)